MPELTQYDNAMKQGDIPKAITILKPLTNETRNKIRTSFRWRNDLDFSILGNANEVFKDWDDFIKDGDVSNTWDGYIKVYVTEKELINKYIIS